MTTEFNTPLAVRVLASIEESRTWDDWQGPRWNQGAWGMIDNPSAAPVRLQEGNFGSKFLDAIVDLEGNIVGWGSCGTAMCFAGWALSLEKVPMHWAGTNELWLSTAGENKTDPSRAAADLLGIEWTPHPEDCECEDELGEACSHDRDYPLWYTDEDMPLLFKGGNNIGDLYRIVAAHAEISEEELRQMVHEQMAADRRRDLTQA